MSLEKTFPIYTKKHASGNVGYRVDMGIVAGKRVFRSFPNRSMAERFQQKCLASEAKKKPVDLRDLSDVMRHEVLAALAKLRQHNATITQAVDFFLTHGRPEKPNATINDVMEEFKKAKQDEELSEKYLKTAHASFFVPFRDHFKDCELNELTKDSCEKYLFKSKSWSPSTRRAHLRHLSALLKFAEENGYIGYNPLAKTKTKKPTGTSRKRVVGVENVIKLLRYAFDNGYKQECAALVLVLFCGVRVDEVTRLTWADVKLDEENPVVVLDEHQTKTGKTRINAIPPNAMEWLTPLRAKGKIVPVNYEGRMRYLKKKAEAGFKQNSARICFASYHLAHHGDAVRTAFLLGHPDSNLLFTTYKALVTKEDARRYWRITPDYNGEDDVAAPQPTQEEIDKARKVGIARALGRSVPTPQPDIPSR